MKEKDYSMEDKITLNIEEIFKFVLEGGCLKFETASIFRIKHLMPALNKYENVIIDLGDVVYSSSWLQRVFIDIPSHLHWKLLFIAEDESLELEIREYLLD